MSGEGTFAEHIRQLHALACRKYFGDKERTALNTSLFIKGGQMKLF
jgi:hypothetical protein